MFTRRPKTKEEIRAEIAELTRRRDAMLKSAPKHVIARRVLMPLMLIPILATNVAAFARGVPSWPHALIVLAVLGIFGSGCYKVWRPGFSRHDPWDASDRLGYDGESPREVQRRIEALKADLRDRG